MTTAAAQRRLLEALAGVSQPRGLASGLANAAENVMVLAAFGTDEDRRSAGEVAAVYVAVAELVRAVTNEREAV